ncbi:acyl carrier protein [Embleya sp. NPDC050493]|uniref:acyl carrier protein n=1 Tax=Embleya sp. NPDC050493 TaxID=3363989 RepID=UPI0037BD41B0
MNTSRHLREMSRRERRDALEDLVVAYLKEILLMDDGEELPLDQGYFDLGLTSLRLNDVRSRLERSLDIGIDATILFGRPTVEQLVAYLTDVLSAPPAEPIMHAADSRPPGTETKETSDVG